MKKTLPLETARYSMFEVRLLNRYARALDKPHGSLPPNGRDFVAVFWWYCMVVGAIGIGIGESDSVVKRDIKERESL